MDGGDGDDTFFGVYNHSALIAGAGKNTFGRKGRLSMEDPSIPPDDPKIRQAQDKHFSTDLTRDTLTGLTQAQQFQSVSIDAGKGDSSMYGVFQASDITLGSGQHNLTGVFSNSNVKSERGKSAIAAYYAEGSSFNGQGGQNSLHVRTGKANVADFGGGTSSISMGAGQGSPDRMHMDGETWDLEQTEWFMNHAQKDALPRSGVTDGTLDHNVIDASEGSQHINVHTKDEDHELMVRHSAEGSMVVGKKTASVKTGEESPFLTGETDEASSSLADSDLNDRNQAVEVRTGIGESLSFQQSNAARKRKRLYYTDYSS